MKNYLIAGLICLVAAMAFGIEPVQRAINETTNRGTLRGVETCMDYSKSALLSQDAVKAACVQSFQNRLYAAPDSEIGQAGPRIDKERGGWGGTLENKTSDHVTTWIRIVVTIFEADGTKQEVFAETPIWINPLGEAEFWVELPDTKLDQFDGMDFCEIGDKAPKSCMGWGVIDMMGLAI